MGKIEDKIVKTKSGREVLITSPKLGDGESLLECVQEIMKTSEHLLTTFAEFTYTAVQEDEMILRYLAHPDKVIITPKINGRIIGMMDFSVGARMRTSHQGEFGMSVHPDFQGDGLGRAMLEALIAWAKENPRIEILRLRVFSKNQNAISLYEARVLKKKAVKSAA